MDKSTQEIIDIKAEELYPVKSMRDFIVCNNGTSHDAFVRGAQFAFETLSKYMKYDERDGLVKFNWLQYQYDNATEPLTAKF